MSDTMKDLCRLCAKKHEISKDLLDENNKNVLDLIRQFTQITVTECDNMPTRVCLDCEEKMVSFQLFILECYKIQDNLRKLCLEISENVSIKNEGDLYGLTVIKSEVKDELSAEDLLTDTIQNANDIEESYEGYEDGFQNVSSEDDLDNICIASLKQLKTGNARRKETGEILQKSTKKCKAKTSKYKTRYSKYVKFECRLCGVDFKKFTQLRLHFFRKKHESVPVAYCFCGDEIKSEASLHKHVLHHEADVRKRERQNSDESNDETHQNLKVRNFVNFKCKDCAKDCLSWYKLKSHCERLHKVAPVVTCQCGVTLKSKSVLYKHVQDHRDSGNKLSCDICSKIMKSAAALTKHQMRHVPKEDRKFSCATCEKVFNNKDSLRSHERSHIPIEERKVYNCEVCNLKFTTRSSAASHRRVVHEKVKAYVCDLCGYACGTNGELRQHRAIHSDDKPFVCGKCAKPFKTYSNLKTHMDTHEDTSYVCYVCSRVLNSRRTLRKHLLVHEDKCGHVCSYCNKAFKRRQTLKVHMYTHTGDKPLSCKWCDERFSYASTLRSHRLRAHPDKMAAQAHATYNVVTYNHVAQLQQHQQDYIKSDLAAIGLTKNETEATQ